MRTGTIYMHEFPNGQRYIGQTTQPLSKRFANGNGYRDTEVGKAIKKFGWHSVKTYILYRDIPINELHRYETLCIDRWQTYVDGLNCDSGKTHVSDETRQKISNTLSGKKLPAETRAKMSDARRGEKNPRFGKKHTAASRAKMSKALLGRKRSLESRQKQSQSMTGQKRKPHTAETKVKIGKASRGRKHSAETKAKIFETKRQRSLQRRGQGTLF